MNPDDPTKPLVILPHGNVDETTPETGSKPLPLNQIRPPDEEAAERDVKASKFRT